MTANQVTITGLVLSLIASGAMIAWTRGGRTLLIPAGGAVREDGVERDGWYAGAGAWGQKTSLGALLNELSDVIADVGLYLPLAIVPGFDPRLVVGVVVLSILTEMTGVIAVQIGASRRYDGPFGKSDRAFIFGLLGLLLGLRVPIERAIPDGARRDDFPAGTDDCESVAACVAGSVRRSREAMSRGIHPLASVIAAIARGISGVRVRWQGSACRMCGSGSTSRITPVIWTSLC